MLQERTKIMSVNCNISTVWYKSCYYSICQLTSVYTAVGFNPLKPNDPYSGRTAPLTYKYCILYIY